MFFFFLAEMKVYITTFTLTALLQEMTVNLMVYMVTQERMRSSEAVVIYFASIKYHLQKALPINQSQSQPFCRVRQRELAVCDETKRLHGPGDQFPTSSAGYCVDTKSASPQRSSSKSKSKTLFLQGSPFISKASLHRAPVS